MNPGTFSVSLNVQDVARSQAFYEKLGFSLHMGNPEEGWAIMKNGSTIIGLFQGMLESNGLTFNPGWDQAGEPLAEWQDVRSIQSELAGQGIAIEESGDETGTGPAWFVIQDPDGNRILFDQHR